MARLTLAWKIAAITLLGWRKGVRFDAEHLNVFRQTGGTIAGCQPKELRRQFDLRANLTLKANKASWDRYQ
jgi:hypothetical protein